MNKCIELDKELQKLDVLEADLYEILPRVGLPLRAVPDTVLTRLLGLYFASAGCKEALTSLEAIVAGIVAN